MLHTHSFLNHQRYTISVIEGVIKEHTKTPYCKSLSETLVPSTKRYGVTSHKTVIVMLTSIRIWYGGRIEALSRVEWTSGNISDYCHHYTSASTTTTTEVMVVLVLFIFPIWGCSSAYGLVIFLIDLQWYNGMAIYMKPYRIL